MSVGRFIRHMLYDYEDVSVLMGKTLTNVEVKDESNEYDTRNCEIYFHTSEGEVYLMFHEQDCCESVVIEDIAGDLDDLIGSPITMAEEVIQEGEPDDWGTSTWTFYKFATIKGYVTIRWIGESNGYYSEAVDFKKIDPKELGAAK